MVRCNVIMSEQVGSGRNGSGRIGSGRIGSDRIGSDWDNRVWGDLPTNLPTKSVLVTKLGEIEAESGFSRDIDETFPEI